MMARVRGVMSCASRVGSMFGESGPVDRRQHGFVLLGAVAEREERDVEIHRLRQGRQ